MKTSSMTIACAMCMTAAMAVVAREPDIRHLGGDVVSPASEPDVGGLAADVSVADVDPDFEKHVLGAVRYVVHEKAWQNDVRAQILARYRARPDAEEYRLADDEIAVVRTIRQLLREPHPVRSIDAERRGDAAGSAFWQTFTALHGHLQSVADATRARVQETVGTEAEWFLSQLPGVSDVYTVLVPTAGPVSYVEGRQAQADYVRTRIERARGLEILRRIKNGDDPTLYTAWAQLKGELQAYMDAHRHIGLFRPTPQRPFIVLTSRQFARMIRDGAAPGERMRLTEYARFVEDPSGWLNANADSIVDPRTVGITRWRSEDEAIWAYIRGIVIRWAGQGHGVAGGSLANRLRDVFSPEKPIPGFGDFLDARIGDAKLRMDLRGAYAALVHAVAMRHFGALMAETTRCTGTVLGEDGSPRRNKRVVVLYSDNSSKIILGNPTTDDASRYDFALSLREIVGKLEGRQLAAGRKVFAQYGSNQRSVEADWERLFAGESLQLDINARDAAAPVAAFSLGDVIVGTWVRGSQRMPDGSWIPDGGWRAVTGDKALSMTVVRAATTDTDEASDVRNVRYEGRTAGAGKFFREVYTGGRLIRTYEYRFAESGRQGEPRYTSELLDIDGKWEHMPVVSRIDEEHMVLLNLSWRDWVWMKSK
ncbi:hypothetical protein ACFLSJ_05845 [Verrucomicrobiota bacterium]